MIKNIGLALALASVCLMGGFSCARASDTPYEMEYTNEKPLIVLRFNEPHIVYERPLYNTIARALQVKPSATFDIVSVAPKARSTSDQARYNKMASQNTGKVLATLNEMGLPQNRITLSNITDVVKASEVRIFVH